ncbi:DUF6397 family protein [Streptomyces sp. NPDC004647]|uniref:DUF6397 family protein n=1 Tax=Streptomyces sp. NPDC004647 TaxID=3154671 RepID=UPI0033A461B7
MTVRERGTAHGAGETLAYGRAAEELGLKRRELDLAVQLEEVRTVAVPGTGRRRVPRSEVARLREAEDFPGGLLERVRVVGTAQGAELMGISPERFTRLARVGCFSPVKFYINRYRAVVWLYPARELRTFAEREPGLLTGSTPTNLRAMLDAGEDWRARNWRGRRIGQLARQTDDPWERAALSAAVLAADELADVVDDPYERAYLRRLRPALVPVRADTTATWDVVERLITADDPDEILWNRIGLALSLDEARAVRQAPRPGSNGTADLPAAAATRKSAPVPAPAPGRNPQYERNPDQQRKPEPEPKEKPEPEPKPGPVTESAECSRGLLGWLRFRTG